MKSEAVKICIFQSFSYNIDIAKKLGIYNSTFLSFIALQGEIQGLSLESGKIAFDKDNVFRLTGMDFDKQVEVENSLVSCGLLTVKPMVNSPKRHYAVNIDLLKQALNTQDAMFEKLPFVEQKDIEKSTKKTVNKTEKRILSLKRCIKCDDDVIKQKLCDWIDAVFERGSFITTAGLKLTVDELLKYSNDQCVLISIIDIAIKNGWRDFSWAINSYEKNNKNDASRNFANYSEIVSNGNDIVNEEF